MKDLLDKLSSYNIFNYLFPGILFSVFASKLTSYDLFFENIFIGAFVYYFIGLVVSRIGSLILEPLLKIVKILHFTSYADFIKASKKDPKIELFSEINNMYRTLSAVFISLILLYFFELLKNKYPFISDNSILILVIILITLFLFSYHKQSAYIKARVEQALKSDKKE